MAGDIDPAAADARGLAWLDDEWLVSGARKATRVSWRVRAAGGEPEQLTTVDSAAGEVTHGFRRFTHIGRLEPTPSHYRLSVNCQSDD